MKKTDYSKATALGLINKDRWIDGVPHHPMSKRLVGFLYKHDKDDWGGHFDWKSGEIFGDNGETLMYQMDAFFELLDTENAVS